MIHQICLCYGTGSLLTVQYGSGSFPVDGHPDIAENMAAEPDFHSLAKLTEGVGDAGEYTQFGLNFIQQIVYPFAP